MDLKEPAAQEIVREFLLEIYPEANDGDVEYLWTICNGNPWNAQILWKMVGSK